MVNELDGRLPAEASPPLSPARANAAQPFNSNRFAARFWHGFGFDVIPIFPGTKKPVTTWDPWLNGLSEAKIDAHWRANPTHEVAFIVFDADPPEALALLEAAEAFSGATPAVVVGTKRGQRRNFFRDPDSTQPLKKSQFPKGLDVKSGRTMVFLPPSAGKAIQQDGSGTLVTHARELTVATQAFLDALKLDFNQSNEAVVRNDPRAAVEVSPQKLPAAVITVLAVRLPTLS